MTPLQIRSLLFLLPILLAAWPMRDGLFSGEMVGAGPDVTTTLWTMWWYQKEWTDAAWVGISHYFNYPLGGRGAILSPLTATTWALLDPMLGPNRAGALTSWSQIALFGGAVAWLAREIGLSKAGAIAALLACFCQRYLFFGTGETSIVGISALPIPIGLIALLRLQKGAPQSRWLILATLCMGLQPLENPYLTPVLPGVALLMLIRPIGRKRLAWALLSGIAAIVLVGLIHKSATTLAYESTKPTDYVGWGNVLWPVVERPWAAAQFQWFFWPPATVWSEGADQTVNAQGREYLGLSVLFLSAIAVWKFPKKSLPWLGFGLIGVVLSMGSSLGGFPGPFALLNAVCLRLVRALTQPTRYLVLSHIGLALTAAWGFEAVRRHSYKAGWIAGGVLAIDAFLVGGLSLQLPTMRVPTPSCVEALEQQEGAVLIWPWDGADRHDPEAPTKSRMLQVAHSRPGATIGTGSWPLVGRVFPGETLRANAWIEGFKGGNGYIELQELSNKGFQWIVADMGAPDRLLGDPDALFGNGQAPYDACPGYRVYKMPPPLMRIDGAPH